MVLSISTDPKFCMDVIWILQATFSLSMVRNCDWFLEIELELLQLLSRCCHMCWNVPFLFLFYIFLLPFYFPGSLIGVICFIMVSESQRISKLYCTTQLNSAILKDYFRDRFTIMDWCRKNFFKKHWHKCRTYCILRKMSLVVDFILEQKLDRDQVSVFVIPFCL